MADQTRTQRESQEFAQAVFADPAVRDDFEQMARDTASREPVPDDFAWLNKAERDIEPPVARAKFQSDLHRSTRSVVEQGQADS